MSDEARVPVKTGLRPVEYRWLESLGKQHHTTVGSLVAEIVRQAFVHREEQVRPVQRDKHQRITDQDRELIRDLHARGWTDSRISKTFGCSPQTIWNHREAMGLPSNYKPTRKETTS